MTGVSRRLQRFFPQAEALPGGRCLLLALDHGPAEGLLPGAVRLPELLAGLAERPIQGVVLHQGMARAHALDLSPSVQLAVQLSAGTKHGLPGYGQTQVCSVQQAARLGADAVSLRVNIGNDLEDRMLADLGAVVEEAHLLGLPVLAVIYARGGQIVQELDPSLIAHCVRLGGELGADLVSAPFSGDPESFALALESCPVPVLVAGGPRQADFDAYLAMTAKALACGAAGVLVGRNVLLQPDPLACLDRLIGLVHGASGEAGEPDREDAAPDA